MKTPAAARETGLAGLDRDVRRRRNRVEHFCRRLRDELDRLDADDQAVLAFHEAAALLRTREPAAGTEAPRPARLPRHATM